MTHQRSKATEVLARRGRKRAIAEAAHARDVQRDRARALEDLATKHILVNPLNLAPDKRYGTPEFVARGYYIDMPFVCKACGARQVWTEAQQKWWYETAKGKVWTVAVLCRPCRRREREHRRSSMEGQACKASQAQPGRKTS